MTAPTDRPQTPADARPSPPIRDAATVLLVRAGASGPEVLMGQRGAGAVFMPSKFVFPGGAVDAADADIPFARGLSPLCQARLREAPLREGELNGGGTATPAALAAAAIRELWEETGLRLGTPGAWPGPVPADWADFAKAGLLPDASALSFVFRAITPPGRPRRFDARFFLADATHLADAADDFSRATDELSYLQWVPLTEARRLDLPFITEVVLAEVAALLAEGRHQPQSVPFFDNSGRVSKFSRLSGVTPDAG